MSKIFGIENLETASNTELHKLLAEITRHGESLSEVKQTAKNNIQAILERRGALTSSEESVHVPHHHV